VRHRRVFAQLRVDTIRDNTLRGLAHAQGRIAGRPTVMPPERVIAAAQMYAGAASLAHIAKVLGMGKSSVARALSKLSRTQTDRSAALSCSAPPPNLTLCWHHARRAL